MTFFEWIGRIFLTFPSKKFILPDHGRFRERLLANRGRGCLQPPEAQPLWRWPMSDPIPTVIIRWPQGLDQTPVIYPNTGNDEQDDIIRDLLEKALWAHRAG